MDLYHTTDVDGISMLNPDADAMRDLLAQLDEADIHEAEHPDVSLIHDPSGWFISVFPNGTVSLDNLDTDGDDAPIYMNNINRQDALKMWLELSRGEIERVQAYPWIRNDS